MPYSVLGGKFTRYFTMAEPIILIVAAVGMYFGLKWLTALLGAKGSSVKALQAAALLLVIGIPIANSIASMPHYRLFTNSIGTYLRPAGSYFPHDEIYDGSTREAIADIGATAPQGVTVASETPGLVEYYAERAGRPDIRSVLLSDKAAATSLKVGDVILETKGRRYFSNTALLDALQNAPATDVKMGDVVSNRIFRIDASTAAKLQQ